MPSDPLVARHEIERLVHRGPRTSFDSHWFTFGDIRLEPTELVGILGPHVSEARAARIDQALRERTYTLAVAVEGMVDSGNVSAVMRTAEAFGVQPFHAIDTAASYKHSKRTSQGAEKWLDRFTWSDTSECIRYLRHAGYRVAAADLGGDAMPIAELDFTVPTAMLFGNELAGLSARARELADVAVEVPINGFVQSFNISVAAAICLYQAREDRLARRGHHGDLISADRDRLKAVFTYKSVRHARRLVERALQERSDPV